MEVKEKDDALQRLYDQGLLRGKTDPAALAALLDEWMQGDAEEQRETFEALRKGLDEDRPEGYKLFP